MSTSESTLNLEQKSTPRQSHDEPESHHALSHVLVPIKVLRDTHIAPYVSGKGSTPCFLVLPPCSDWMLGSEHRRSLGSSWKSVCVTYWTKCEHHGKLRDIHRDWQSPLHNFVVHGRTDWEHFLYRLNLEHTSKFSLHCRKRAQHNKSFSNLLATACGLVGERWRPKSFLCDPCVLHVQIVEPTLRSI